MPHDKLSLPLMLRLRFIDFLLDNYGTFNRGFIADYFGLSVPQASMDIRAYIEVAPGNLEYDRSGKVYRRTAGFSRVWP